MDALGLQTIQSFDRLAADKRLHAYKATGEKVFTNAYLVSGYQQYASFGDKISRIMKLLEDIAVLIPKTVTQIELAKDSKATYEFIRELPGL